MAQHPAYTMSGLTGVGGIFGFLRARSLPSLLGGLAVSSLYGAGGYRIEQNKDDGFALCVAASTLLVGSSLRRALKFIPLPLSLSSLGILSGLYYGNKLYRARVGY